MINITRRRFIGLSALALIGAGVTGHLGSNQKELSQLKKINISEISNKKLRETIIIYNSNNNSTTRQQSLAQGYSFWHKDKLYSFWDVKI